ncbi:MAG: hypothetical protein JSU63_07155 [Phycisphaerales bacterium]|nr:MAG: hypothetical protein JSU63_07155 [Phycisphaerales bacterium]
MDQTAAVTRNGEMWSRSLFVPVFLALVTTGSRMSVRPPGDDAVVDGFSTDATRERPWTGTRPGVPARISCPHFAAFCRIGRTHTISDYLWLKELAILQVRGS